MLASQYSASQNSYTLRNLLSKEFYAQMNEADRLVTDEYLRGYLPRLALGLRPDLPVHLMAPLQLSEADLQTGNLCILTVKPHHAAAIMEEFAGTTSPSGWKVVRMDTRRYTLISLVRGE